MIATDRLRYGFTICPHCDRGICLIRDGRLRRHFALTPAGLRRLCTGSHKAP